MPDQTVDKNKGDHDDSVEYDPHYEPVVSLPIVKVSTNEEEEVEMCKVRAKLYRFCKDDHEWKERGTGEIKMLHHPENSTVRIVMRRDKTLKLCANHFITEDMKLQPHIGSNRTFNWTTFGDYADEICKQEFLAVKFGNVENADLWKSKFEEALKIVESKSSLNVSKTTEDTLESEESSLSSNASTPEKHNESHDRESNLIEIDIKKEKEVILQLTDLTLGKEITPANE